MHQSSRFNLSSHRDLLALAAVATASAVVLLTNLGLAPVQMWDEARVAINALEMMSASNPLIVTYRGEIDLWNTKPPLAALLAALSMHVGGTNELALRIPAALAAGITVFAVFWFVEWVTGRRSTALLAALILLGTGGYVESHVARTAEPDSLMVMFLTVTTFGVVRWIDDGSASKSGNGWLLVAVLSLIGAVLTKGVAAFLVLPGFLIGLIATDRVALLRSRQFVLASAILVLAVLLYWGGMEFAAPGYWAAVSSTEMGRYFEPLPGAAGRWYSYLVQLVWPWQATPFFGDTKFISTSSAFPWSVLIIALAPLLRATSAVRERRTAIFLMSSLFGFLVVISASATKLDWYSAPAFPLIAVLTALGLSELARRMRRAKHGPARRLGAATVPVAFVAALVSMGFVVWKNEAVARDEAYLPTQRLGSFLREISPRLPDDRPIRIISDASVRVPEVRGGQIVGTAPYEGPAEFYVRLLQRSGHDARIVSRDFEPSGGTLIAGCGPVPPRFDRLSVKAAVNDCFLLSTAKRFSGRSPRPGG